MATTTVSKSKVSKGAAKVAVKRGRPVGSKKDAPVKPVAPRVPLNDEQVGEFAQLADLAGDKTRVGVLQILKDGEMSVNNMVTALGLSSQPALSHHLSLLRHSRVVSTRRDGKQVFYSLAKRGKMLNKMFEALVTAKPE